MATLIVKYLNGYKYIFSKIETMIIVKNKSVSTPIFINRDSVKAVENVEGIEYITKSEFNSALNRKQDNLVSGKNIKTINGESIVGEGDIVINGGSDADLTNYYTKEEVDELLANVGEDIPYFVVNSDWTGYEKGDFESVRQAIIDGKPHFIYAPAPLGGYFSPNYVKVNFGQINCHFFYHTDNGANYYYFVYFQSDRINKSEKTIFYATTAELAEMGSYTLFIENDEQFGYQFYGKTTSSLKYYYNNNKNIAIKVKDNGIFYDANNISFTDDDGAIFFIDKIVDGELISVKFEVGYDDEMFENYIKNITETKIVGGSDDGEMASIVELTQNEYNQLIDNGQIDDKTIYLITDAATNLKTINGETLFGDGNISVPTQAWVTEQINSQIGNIETALTNIIGN